MAQIASQPTLTEEIAAFLASGPTPEELATYHISEQARERVAALMEKNKDGALTPEEAAELDEITVLDQLFTLVRARLTSPSSDA